MSLSDAIKAMLAEKEELNREKMEQQQIDEGEQRRLLTEFQEQLPILLKDIVLPKLREVQAILSDNERIRAAVPEHSDRAILTFSPSDNMYGTQFSISFYGAEGIRAMGVRTGSGNQADDPFRDEQHLKLSEVTPEWLDSYLSDFIKRVLDSGKLI